MDTHIKIMSTMKDFKWSGFKGLIKNKNRNFSLMYVTLALSFE